MLIEITKADSGYYKWTLHDGPDGIDKRTGSNFSLKHAFDCILEARADIAASYTEAEPSPIPEPATPQP